MIYDSAAVLKHTYYIGLFYLLRRSGNKRTEKRFHGMGLPVLGPLDLAVELLEGRGVSDRSQGLPYRAIARQLVDAL